MTPTLQTFAARLHELHGDSLSMTFADGPPPTATIPARHPQVGDMTIYDDGFELTIVVGRHHHTHISNYNYDSYPEEDRLGMVARDAAEFVNDIMCDRVCIAVYFKGERCTGSSHSYLDEDDTRMGTIRGVGVGDVEDETRSDRYLWSGPIN